jgi:nitrite reductase/ring-hydroxylating ferredoxin subunit
MMTNLDNETLVRTNPGSPMGELFRRFWIPALLASELPAPDLEPVRFRLLGEDLIAFRNSEGRVGVIDAYCPHRGAPLEFGRNEECGIRCLYHGWKFDVEGNCVDMPNVAQGDTIRKAMRVTAYPAAERAGMVWVYMGPAERRPPLPELGCFTVPQDDRHIYVQKYEMECNWLQALEADFDATHAPYLHSDRLMVPGRKGMDRFTQMPIAYELIEETPYGSTNVYNQVIGAVKWVVCYHFLLPAFASAGAASPATQSMNMRIPIDDAHCWWFRLRWAPDGFAPAELNEHRLGGNTFAPHEPGGWRPAANRSNRYGFDGVIQRKYNYSGLPSFMIQDFLVAENQWGPIADRTREHLVASDRHIILNRRRLLSMAKALADGKEPEEPFRPEIFAVREARIDIPKDAEVTEDLVREVMRRAQTLAGSAYETRCGDPSAAQREQAGA